MCSLVNSTRIVPGKFKTGKNIIMTLLKIHILVAMTFAHIP